jgi:hypothetical protein
MIKRIHQHAYPQDTFYLTRMKRQLVHGQVEIMPVSAAQNPEDLSPLKK